MNDQDLYAVILLSGNSKRKIGQNLVRDGLTIRLKTRAERELDRLPFTLARRIWRKLLVLAKDSRSRGTSKLEESDGYRIRIGDYRIVYIVDDREQTVDIIRVAHRREVYR